MIKSNLNEYGPVLGRIFLALLFIVSGIGMLINFGGTVGYFESMGIPVAMVAVILVLIVKIGGGLMVATGVHAKEGALALAGFTLLTILVAHLGEGQINAALKNLAIVGGLLYVAAHGAGKMTLLKNCPCPKCKKGDTAAAVCTIPGMCTCGVCEDCRGGKPKEEVVE